MPFRTFSFFAFSALTTLFFSFSVKNIGYALSNEYCTIELSSRLKGEGYKFGSSDFLTKPNPDDKLELYKEECILHSAKSTDVANTPTLTIISKKTYEDQYKSIVSAMHIIRLKSLNPTISIRSIPETKEGLSQINFPSSPSMQAYYLYSGSCLIVENNKK